MNAYRDFLAPRVESATNVANDSNKGIVPLWPQPMAIRVVPGGRLGETRQTLVVHWAARRTEP